MTKERIRALVVIFALVLIVVVSLCCKSTFAGMVTVIALVNVCSFYFGYDVTTNVKGPCGEEYSHKSQKHKNR